jgi:hypothetical protein
MIWIEVAGPDEVKVTSRRCVRSDTKQGHSDSELGNGRTCRSNRGVGNKASLRTERRAEDWLAKVFMRAAISIPDIGIWWDQGCKVALL